MKNQEHIIRLIQSKDKFLWYPPEEYMTEIITKFNLTEYVYLDEYNDFINGSFYDGILLGKLLDKNLHEKFIHMAIQENDLKGYL